MVSQSSGDAFNPIDSERCIRHLGTARVSITALCFPYSRELNPKNVKRLERLFQQESGCRPDDYSNRIPAVISETELLQLLRASNLDETCLLTKNPEHFATIQFPLGASLECLHGRHRVEAAKKVFSTQNKDWVVDFYSADLSEDLRYTLIEEYKNEQKPNDGDFYLKIQTYKGIFGDGKNRYFERRWWARLAAISNSTDPKRNLQRLLNHRIFARAFDAFHCIPALYSGLRLSAIGKMVTLGCHEELCFCLGDIREFFYEIFAGDELKMYKMKVSSLKAIELTAPGACKREADELMRRIEAGEVFGEFTEIERKKIWDLICMKTTDRLIPSLYMFFENLKYLKGPADCMKRLVTLKQGESIRATLENTFQNHESRSGSCLIQLSQGGFMSISHPDRFNLLYRQLWLWSFREYWDVPKLVKRKLAGPQNVEANEGMVYKLASLAHKLGFQTPQIRDILEQNPDRTMTRQFLQKIRKQDGYQYLQLEDTITEIVSLLNKPDTVTGTRDHPEPDLGNNSCPPRRCGIPSREDGIRDKPFLFLDRLHGPFPEQQYITSRFIQRSIYLSFFGKNIGINSEEFSHKVSSHIHLQNDSLVSRQGPTFEIQSPKSEHKKKLQQSRGELASLENQISIAQATLLQLEQSLAERLQKNNEFEEKNQQLENQIKLLGESCKRRSQEGTLKLRKTKDRRIDKPKRQYILTENYVNGPREKAKGLEQNIEDYKQQIESLEEEIRRLNGRKLEEMSKLEHHINEFGQQQTRLKQQITDLTEQRSNLENAIDQLKEQESKLLETVDNLRQGIEIDQNVNDHTQHVESLKVTIEQLEQQKAELHKIINERRQEILELRENFDHRGQKIIEFEQYIDECDQKQIKLEQEIKQVNQNQLGLDQNIVHDRQLVANLEEKIDQLKRQEIDLEKSVDQRGGQQLQLEKNIENLKEELDILETARKELSQMTIQFLLPIWEHQQSEFLYGNVKRSWKVGKVLSLHISNPSKASKLVEKVADEYLKSGFALFDGHNQALSPQNCFQAAINSTESPNKIFLKRHREAKTDNNAFLKRRRDADTENDVRTNLDDEDYTKAENRKTPRR